MFIFQFQCFEGLLSELVVLILPGAQLECAVAADYKDQDQQDQSKRAYLAEDVLSIFLDAFDVRRVTHLIAMLYAQLVATA